jgi:phosphoenolpyruvate synthase/pyruvate phosphate dikinase
VQEDLLTRAQAIATVDARSLHALLHPTFDPEASHEVVSRGVAASPGAAKGAIVFTAPDAVAAANDGRAVILVRPFTEADDVAGFHAAKGILTSEGGKASHAALVARGMGRPAVTGAGEVDYRTRRGGAGGDRALTSLTARGRGRAGRRTGRGGAGRGTDRAPGPGRPPPCARRRGGPRGAG